MNKREIESAITAEAQRAGVDPTLALGVARQESGLNPAARSPKGAIGLFQLMPATAAGLGVDPVDTQQNIAGGIRYLRQMLNLFGGDLSLALAAYNAGPNAVAKYNGIPPYRETQDYVSRILQAVGVEAPAVSDWGGVDLLSELTSSSDSLMVPDWLPWVVGGLLVMVILREKL